MPELCRGEKQGYAQGGAKETLRAALRQSCNINFGSGNC